MSTLLVYSSGGQGPRRQPENSNLTPDVRRKQFRQTSHKVASYLSESNQDHKNKSKSTASAVQAEANQQEQLSDQWSFIQ